MSKENSQFPADIRNQLSILEKMCEEGNVHLLCVLSTEAKVASAVRCSPVTMANAILSTVERNPEFKVLFEMVYAGI